MLSSRLFPFPGRWLAVPPGKDVSVRGQGEGETDRLTDTQLRLAARSPHVTQGTPGLETMNIWVHGGQGCLRAKSGLER